MRTNELYRLNVKKTLSCNSKSEKTKMETRLLLFSSTELTIFLTNKILLVNLMHHLFLGITKHMIYDMWIGKNFVDRSSLLRIEHWLHIVVVPSGLGCLPVAIAVGFFLTAEEPNIGHYISQFIACTLYFLKII